MVILKYVRGLEGGAEGSEVDAFVSKLAGFPVSLELTRKGWSGRVFVQDILGAEWKRVGVLNRNTELILDVRRAGALPLPLILEGPESDLAKLYEDIAAAQRAERP